MDPQQHLKGGARIYIYIYICIYIYIYNPIDNPVSILNMALLSLIVTIARARVMQTSDKATHPDLARRRSTDFYEGLGANGWKESFRRDTGKRCKNKVRGELRKVSQHCGKLVLINHNPMQGWAAGRLLMMPKSLQ